jgi:dTMP kinase
MSQSSALFITLEGGEGAGKTTLMDRLSLHFSQSGHDVVTTREPGGTDLGAKVRHLLLHEKAIQVTKKAELFLFLADRAQHVEEIIKPALKRGSVVISDRFFDSTLAYQGAARQFDLEAVEKMCLFATGELVPDCTLFLDIDPLDGLKRARNVDELDRMESEALSFHESVRAGFLDIAKKQPKRLHRIDASLSPEEVFSQAVACLKN